MTEDAALGDLGDLKELERLPSLLRESPATCALGLLWIAIYAAMVWHQGSFVAAGGNLLTGGILPVTSHPFGDQTPAAIGAGQVWRALTSTFVHYSILHLGLNLIGFLQFGRLVEGWYGSGPLVAIYAAIGFFGNLLSGLFKLWTGAPPIRPSGGGSGVVVGLIALIAVAGWRSRTRFGQFVQGQMFLLLFLTGLMGLFFPWLDNTGHAAGAVVGTLIGLAHPTLTRMKSSARRLLGVIGVLAIALSAAAQVRADHREVLAIAAQRRAESLYVALIQLAKVEALYGEIARRGPHPPPPRGFYPAQPSNIRLRQELRAAIKDLSSLQVSPEAGTLADADRRIRTLATRALTRVPTPGEAHSFETAMGALIGRIRQELSRLPAPRAAAANSPPRSS